MSAEASLPPGGAQIWIGRGVVLELLRRKDVYVVGLLMLVFSIGSLGVRFGGTLSPATGTFLLNLGLSLAYLFSHAVTLLLAVRQIPTEVENRTLYPILARPVSRGQVLTGKWLACTLCGILTYGVFVLMVWLAAPKLETYSSGLFGQTLVLHLASLSLTASLALLLSLLVPRGLAVLLTGALLFLGGTVLGFLESMVASHRLESAMSWLLSYLPDFTKLNLTTRYTDGMPPVDAGMFLGLVLYSVFYTSLVLYGSYAVFRRRSL